MINKDSFFIPLVYDKPSPKEAAESAVDNYFYLGGKIAQVDDTRAYVTLIDPPPDKTGRDKAKTWGLNLIKIISYLTLIIPLGFLIAKAAIRSSKELFLPTTDQPEPEDAKIDKPPVNTTPLETTPDTPSPLLEGVLKKIQTMTIDYKSKKIPVTVFSLSPTLPDPSSFINYQDPIDETTFDECKDSPSLSFISDVNRDIFLTTTIAEWLSNLPCQTTLKGQSSHFWKSSEEYQELIEFLINHSAEDIKTKLETQLNTFLKIKDLLQTLENDYDIIKILDSLLFGLNNKLKAEAEPFGWKYLELKNAFPEEIGNFLFPEEAFSKKTQYCVKHAHAIIYFQWIRLCSFLKTKTELSLDKNNFDKDFDKKFENLIQKLKEIYPK